MPTPPDADLSTLQIVAGLIEQQMRLGAGGVSVYNQKRRIPPKTGCFVDVASLGVKVYGSNSKAISDPETEDMIEIQSAATQEQVQVDIFSSDFSAQNRRIEIIFALSGIAAQQACEKYALQIGRLPTSFVAVPSVEASARLTRFAIAFNVIRTYSQTLGTRAWNQFSIPPKITVNA